MKTMRRAFLDSDVVISSLLSSRGAAHFVLESDEIERVLSPHSRREIEKVAARMAINAVTLQSAVHRCQVVPLAEAEQALMQRFGAYVSDGKDAHAVAGAVEARAQFLLTYNIRHFHHERIKADFDILIMAPGLFLQYMRSKV